MQLQTISMPLKNHNNSARTASIAVNVPCSVFIATSKSSPSLPTCPLATLSTEHANHVAAAARASAAVCRAMEKNQQPFSASPTSELFHFDEDDYHRVTLVSPPFGPLKLEDVEHMPGSTTGKLVFQRECDPSPAFDQTTKVIEMDVAGDTAYNLWLLLSDQKTDRPLTHQLMWNLMRQAANQQCQSWSLLRTAIVKLEKGVFHGRLFFGDPTTGIASWDCDCRASDAKYLSLQAGCPFFIHRRVWDIASIPLLDSHSYKKVTETSTTSTATTKSSSTSTMEVRREQTPDREDEVYNAYSSYYYRSGSPGGGPDYIETGNFSPPRPLTVEDITLLRPDDLDAIKLLKRQLAVALGEDDFQTAINIRDHPWMVIYRDMHSLRIQGRYNEAHRLEVKLRRLIEAASDTAGW